MDERARVAEDAGRVVGDRMDAELLAVLWTTFARMRRGTVYQPTGGQQSQDPNGCGPKLELLRASGYRFGGARVLSLGANGGFYERALAQASYGRVPRRAAGGAEAVPLLDDGPVAAMDLVDIDADALGVASRALVGPAVREVRTFTCAAERFPFEPGYDLCLFLSLYHHYDRLGGGVRRAGIRLLGDIGRCCQTLFFETGQSDDPSRGAERWRTRLEMCGSASPSAWLESAVPRYTGYTGIRQLGTNPLTKRHLYAYWHERVVPARAFWGEEGAGAAVVIAVRASAERGLHFSSIEAPLPDDGAGALDAFGTRPLLLDCEFTQPGSSRESCARAVALLCDLLRSGCRGTLAIIVHDPGALRFIPRSVPVIVQSDATGDELSLVLSATRYAGGRVVYLEGPGSGGPARGLADALGLRLAPAPPTPAAADQRLGLLS